jgi:hypothetical protein
MTDHTHHRRARRDRQVWLGRRHQFCTGTRWRKFTPKVAACPQSVLPLLAPFVRCRNAAIR